MRTAKGAAPITRKFCSKGGFSGIVAMQFNAYFPAPAGESLDRSNVRNGKFDLQPGHMNLLIGGLLKTEPTMQSAGLLTAVVGLV